MRNKLASILAFAALAWGLSSCEKEVDLQINPGEQKLVVNASIRRSIDAKTGVETGEFPLVILTKSINFFGNLDSAALADFFVHDAQVTLSNGSKTISLKEYQISGTGVPGAPDVAYFYSLIDTSAPNLMQGEFNTNYELRIEWQGQTYTSTSTIYPPVPIDSFWTQDANVPGTDTVFTELRARFTDPPLKGQNYHTMVNSYYPNNIEASFDDYFNDEVTNGVGFNFTIGSANADAQSNERYGYWLPGDSLTLEWSSIDYAAYQFFNTKNFSGNSIGNPFATPVNVIGNISNGALGAFIAMGTLNYAYKIN